MRTLPGRLASLLPPARLVRLVSHLLIVIGGFIFCAYLFLPDTILARISSLLIAPPNAALCFVLAGCALPLAPDSRIRRGLGGMMVFLALPVLAQYLSGWYSHRPSLHMFLVVIPEVIQPWQASMSMLASIGLLSAGMFLLLASDAVASSVRMSLVVLTLVTGLIGGVARILDIADLLLIEPYSNGMRPSIAILMILLSIGLIGNGFTSLNWNKYFAHRVDRQLAATGMLLLLILGISAGMTGVAAVVKQENAVSRAMLHNALAYNVELIDAAIGERIKLHQLAAGLADIDVSGVGLEYCERQEQAALLIPLAGTNAELLWREGLYLRTRHDRDRAAGSAICSSLSSLLFASQQVAWRYGATYDTLICGKVAAGRIGCLPSRFRQQPFGLPQRLGRDDLPVIRALAGGASTVNITDYRGHHVVAAYRQSAWKLGVVQEIDLDEFYAPFRRRVWIGMAIVLALTLLGGSLLYLFTRPMVATLQQLRRSTQAIVDHAPIAIVSVDRNGMAQLLNPAAERMFNRGPESECHLADLLTESSRPQTASIVQLAAEQDCISAQVKAFDGKGGVFDAEMHLCAYQLDGEFHWIGLFSDISARLKYESELSWWKQVFDHAKWGIAISNANGQTLEMVNPWFAGMHGYTPEELLGQPITCVFSPAGGAELPAHLRRINEQGHYCFESEHRRKDGSTFPVLIDVTVVQNAQREAMYRVANVLDISERKQMERTLGDRERLLRMVMDTQQEMIVRWLPDHTVVFVNQAVCRFLGRGRAQLIGRSWLEQGLLLDTIAQEPMVLKQTLDSVPRLVREEREMLDASGNKRLIAWLDAPIFDKNGQIECVQSMGLDITEERQAELALRESELRFAAIFHSMFQFTAVLSPSGVLLEVNDTALEFASIPHQAAIGRYFWETPWWRKNRRAQSDLQVLVHEAAQGRLARAEMEIHGTADKRALLDLSLKPVRNDAGAVAWLIAEGRDITRAKQDSEMAAAQDRRLRALSANVPGMVFQLYVNPRTERARFSYVSEGAEELCGMTRAELLDGHADIQSVVYADDLPSFVASFRHCSGTLEEWLWNGRVIDKRGGVLRWVSLRAQPHPGADGDVVFDGLVLNISEVKQQESEVERSRGMLRELAAHLDSVREEERKRIAREVHDELGQTLTALRMEIAMLEMETETVDQPKHARSLSMKSLVDQAIGVVRDVASSLRPVALDMGLVPALMWLASEFQQRTGVACSVELFTKQIKLDDDRATVLFRIVQESLTNILRHAEAKHVFITLGKVGRRYMLEIRDDGKGFDTHGAKRANAFGLLGMHERATMLGGSAEVISEPGAGTVVKVEVPEK